MCAPLGVVVVVASILLTPGADANVKLIPIETKTIHTDDGATHEISRYVVVPEGHTNKPENSGVIASTDLYTSLGSDKHSTASTDQDDTGILETQKVNDDTKTHIHKYSTPEVARASTNSIRALGSSNENENKQTNNENVSKNDSHRKKGEAKYRSSSTGYSKVKVKVTHYQDPSIGSKVYELNENTRHSNVNSDAYKLQYKEKVQKEHPDMIAVNINGSTEEYESPLNVENEEETVKDTGQNINDEVSSYHNGQYRTKIVRKKIKNPIKVNNIDSKDLPMKWNDFFNEPSITEKGKVPTSIPINETFTLPGKRGRFKIIYEDDDDNYEYDTIEKPTLVRIKPKGRFKIHATQKYYIDSTKAKKAGEANKHINTNLKTLTINNDDRDSAVIYANISTDSGSRTENDKNSDTKRLTNSEIIIQGPTLVLDKTAGISKKNEERKENAQIPPPNNIISGFTAGDEIGYEITKSRLTSIKTYGDNISTPLTGKTNIHHTMSTLTPPKSRKNITNDEWTLDNNTHENSSAANKPTIYHQKIETIETTKTTQNHTNNLATEPVLYSDKVTLSSYKDEKEIIKTDEKTSLLTSNENEKRTKQSDIKAKPIEHNLIISDLKPIERIKLLPSVNQTHNKKNTHKTHSKNKEVIPDGIHVLRNNNRPLLTEIISNNDKTIIHPTKITRIQTDVRGHPKENKDVIQTSSSKITSLVHSTYEETPKIKILSNTHTEKVPAVTVTHSIISKTGISHKDNVNVPRVEKESILQTKHSIENTDNISVLPEKSIHKIIISKNYPIKIVGDSKNDKKMIPEQHNKPIDIVETVSKTESKYDTKKPINNVLEYLGRQRNSKIKAIQNSEIRVSHEEIPEVAYKTLPINKTVMQPRLHATKSLGSQCHLSIGNVYQKENLPKTYSDIKNRDKQSHEDQAKQTGKTEWYQNDIKFILNNRKHNTFNNIPSNKKTSLEEIEEYGDNYEEYIEYGKENPIYYEKTVFTNSQLPKKGVVIYDDFKNTKSKENVEKLKNRIVATSKDRHTSSEKESALLKDSYKIYVNDHSLIRGVDDALFQKHPYYESSPKIKHVTQKEYATKSASEHNKYNLDHEPFKTSPLQTSGGYNDQVLYTRSDANNYSQLNNEYDSRQLQSLINNLLSRHIIDELSAEYNAAGQIGDKNKIRRATILRHLKNAGVDGKISQEQLNYISKLIEERETYIENIKKLIIYNVNNQATQKNQIIVRNNQKKYYYGPYSYATVSQSQANPNFRILQDNVYLQQHLLEGYDASSVSKDVSDLTARVLYHVAYLRRLGVSDADVLQFIADAKKNLSMQVLRAFVVECQHKSYINSAQSIDRIAKQYLQKRPHTHYAFQYY